VRAGARDALSGFGVRKGRQYGREDWGSRSWLQRRRVRAREEDCLMLRKERAHRNDLMHRAVLRPIEHHAMVLAVPAAAGRKPGVRILREPEQRRHQGKREGRKQQDGEQTPHRIDRFQCTA